jgi:hypothetical protein
VLTPSPRTATLQNFSRSSEEAAEARVEQSRSERKSSLDVSGAGAGGGAGGAPYLSQKRGEGETSSRPRAVMARTYSNTRNVRVSIHCLQLAGVSARSTDKTCVYLRHEKVSERI